MKAALMCWIAVALASSARATSLDPVGAPIRLNVSHPSTGLTAGVAVASDGAGNFVAVWAGWDGSGEGIFARRVSSAGLPGPEFQVNQTFQNSQHDPDVAMAPDGRFVVVWRRDADAPPATGPGSTWVRLYEASGAPAGPELRITPDENWKAQPSVAMAPDGTFVVAWWVPPDTTAAAQRFDSSGAPLSGEINFNAGGGTSILGAPDVAIYPDGGFVVAFTRRAGPLHVVVGRRYDAVGIALGPEFAISDNAYWNENPSLALDGSGGLQVSFNTLDYNQEISPVYIFTRRFAASGVAVGPSVQVNDDELRYSERLPLTAADADGHALIGWDGYDTPSKVRGRLYDAAGTSVQGPFDLAAGNYRVAVAGAAGGRFVVVYSNGTVGAQRLTLGHADDFDADAMSDLVLRHVPTNENVLWLMNGSVRASEQAVTAAPASASQRVAGNDDVNLDHRQDLVLHDPATGGVEFWLMNGASVTERRSLTGIGPAPAGWRLSAVGDVDGDGHADLVWVTSLGQIVVWALDGTNYQRALTPSPGQVAHVNWRLVAAQDFDGDGRRDLLWCNETSGKTVIWYMGPGLVRREARFTVPDGPSAGGNWRAVAAADYGAGPSDFEGTPDIVWRNSDSGRIVVWYMDWNGSRTAGVFTSPPAPDQPLDWEIVGPK